MYTDRPTFLKTNIKVLEAASAKNKRQLAAYQAWMFCVFMSSASTDTIDENAPTDQKLLGFTSRTTGQSTKGKREIHTSEIVEIVLDFASNFILKNSIIYTGLKGVITVCNKYL